MSILEEIFSHKRAEVAIRMSTLSAEALIEQITPGNSRPGFIESLTRSTANKPALIAEVKHKSPSKGVLRKNFDPVELARTYLESGAEAISVLTDEKYFGGHLNYLANINGLLSKERSSIPTLRKDFIFSEYQIIEAAVAGASAVLLIAAMLDTKELGFLIQKSLNHGLEALVEIHNEREASSAVAAGAKLIGINNRDLHTFTVDLQTTLNLRPLLPANATIVSESGIRTRKDVETLAEAGVDAMLVGESLVTEENPAGAIARLRGMQP